MIEVLVNNQKSVPELIVWLNAHGVDCINDYDITMAGIDDDNEAIQFYPKFVFKDTVNEAVLTEFSLRFS